MSYNLNIYNKTADKESDYAYIGMTEPTELLDALLSGQSYADNGINYKRTYADSDTLRKQVRALLDDENKGYLQLIAFTANELLHLIKKHDLLTDSALDDNVKPTWEAIIKNHLQADGSYSPKYQADELHHIEHELADFGGILADMDLRIGNYDGNRLFYLFNVINELREDFNADPEILDKLTFSIG